MEQSSKKRSGTVAGMKDGLKKATTDMLVLFLLRQKPMYAYEMLQEMARLSDGVLQFNTLYIAIYRLQEHGYISPSETVVTESNRTRVYFSITEQGSGYLDDIILYRTDPRRLQIEHHIIVHIFTEPFSSVVRCCHSSFSFPYIRYPVFCS